MKVKRLSLLAPLCIALVSLSAAANIVAPSVYQPLQKSLVGRPLPNFTLPPAHVSRPGLAGAGFRQGRPRLLNLFASWCVPCAEEGPVLMQLRRHGIAIDGIAVRDSPQSLTKFLARNGNPFDRIGLDANGAVEASLGTVGVPVTFVIDGFGVVRNVHIGDIAPEEIPTILAAIREVQ